MFTLNRVLDRPLLKQTICCRARRVGSGRYPSDGNWRGTLLGLITMAKSVIATNRRLGNVFLGKLSLDRDWCASKIGPSRSMTQISHVPWFSIDLLIRCTQCSRSMTTRFVSRFLRWAIVQQLLSGFKELLCSKWPVRWYGGSTASTTTWTSRLCWIDSEMGFFAVDNSR